MKKAIAMKCTREQFDAVKEKIPKERIKDLYNLDSLDCITNIYDDVNGISNIAYGNGKYKGLVIHKTWNEEIFLNACGIETERSYSEEEMRECYEFAIENVQLGRNGYEWVTFDEWFKQFKKK
jgi:hypothetical protein